MDISAVIAKVEASHHERVKVAVVDLDGVLRGKYIHKRKFLSALEKGFGFCNVVFGWDCGDMAYGNSHYTGWHTGYPDAHAQLDPSTYREIPWEDNVPFMLGHFVESPSGDQYLPICPRQLVQRMAEKAKGMGFSTLFGCEYEWFNFSETPESLAEKDYRNPQPLTPGMFGYSLLRSAYRNAYFTDLMEFANGFDVPLEGIHTETGPGVYEAALLATDVVEQADRAVLFKSLVKEIAYQHHIIPSFMARWNDTLPGCSGHLHQSLWSADGKTNVFLDSDDPHGMSETFKHYLAGLIHCVPDLMPMFAPTVNSYKRLVEGFWAPTRSNWGFDNRTVAFRVIPYSRVEARVAGADMNPCLAMAACLGAGLYGIEHQLKLEDEPIGGNGYQDKGGAPFPSNLHEASQRFKQSPIANALFGEAFVTHLANSREWEWQQSQEAVTDWELKRYFEII